jgi:hypothetical protein
MESDKIKNDIIRNLKQIKKESEGDVAEEAVVDENVEFKEMNDNPDELVKNLPKFNQTTFDYEANRYYFDEIYFKNSKLIILYV